MAGECVDHFPDDRARTTWVSNATRMDGGQLTAPVVTLDVCAWVAISGEALMKLIAGVFGIAVILIIAWAILWILSTRKS